jgi:DNA-directed RNA polymerase III subunit RPC6
MAPTLKQEPSTSGDTADYLDKIKNEVFNLVQAYDNGLTESELSRTMHNTSSEMRMNAINALANDGKIQLCKQGSNLVYRVIDSKSTYNHSALQGHSNISIEERAVFRVVESAGSKGIWNREIRNQTKLPLNQMSKVLKNLETKKLIKAVKSVTASKKKLYMLYGLEPDKSVTGGAWYSGTEFESEYVQVLHEQCYQFVKRRLVAACDKDKNDFVEARNRSLVSSSEVKEHIDNLKISNVQLSQQDIEMVLDTIVFDGLIEKIAIEKSPDVTMDSTPIKSEKCLTSDEEDQETSNFTYFYRALAKLVESTGVMRVPCGQCPHVHECRPGAVVNPEKCAYFDRWFST